MICPLTFRVVTALVRLLDETEFDARQDYDKCAKSERAGHILHDINLLRNWLHGDYEGAE